MCRRSFGQFTAPTRPGLWKNQRGTYIQYLNELLQMMGVPKSCLFIVHYHSIVLVFIDVIRKIKHSICSTESEVKDDSQESFKAAASHSRDYRLPQTSGGAESFQQILSFEVFAPCQSCDPGRTHQDIRKVQLSSTLPFQFHTCFKGGKVVIVE